MNACRALIAISILVAINILVTGAVAAGGRDPDEQPQDLIDDAAVEKLSFTHCIRPPPGVTGWWPGDGNTNDIANGRTAYLRNGAHFNKGLVAKAFELDGVNDYVQVPHTPALNVGGGNFTVDLWVKFDQTSGEQLIIEKYIENFADAPPGWFLTKMDDNSLRFGSGGGSFVINSFRLNLQPARWHHVAARRRDSIAAIFLDGKKVASGELRYDASSASSLKWGHRGDSIDTPGSSDDRGFYLDGRIDEVEIYVGRALTNYEIGVIHHAGRFGKCKS